MLTVLIVKGIEDPLHLLPKGMLALAFHWSCKGGEVLGVDFSAEVEFLEGFLQLDLLLPILLESVVLHSWL